MKIWFHLWGDENRGNPPACGFGEPAAGVFALSFVPGQDDEEGFAGRFQHGVEFVHLLFEPAIGEIKFAIVGRVTNIGGDEDEVGQVI